MTRLRILAIAYACNPFRGSEEGVGWGWVNAIAETHQITVLTSDYNEQAIRQYIADHLVSDNLRFIAIRNKPWHYRPGGLWTKIEQSFAKPLMNLAYQDWLGCAFSVASEEAERNTYDLVHLITYVGWRFPGRFHRMNLPFVWGPIGGLKNTPWKLLPALGVQGALYYGGRNLINSLQINILPGPRRALRKARGAVIAATTEIREAIANEFSSQSQVICEIGIPDVTATRPRRRESGEPLRICWSGLHLPGKALHLLLRALARLPVQGDFTLEILGEGPSTREWRTLATRLGIEHRCQWHGQLPRTRALEIMNVCHVLVITSVKELTSTVAVEGLCKALPIVCLDHCGLADLVTDECGIKIPVQSIRKIVDGLSKALLLLHSDEELRYKLAHGAQLRKRKYSWTSKMLTLDRIYQNALDTDRRSRSEVCRSDVTY